MAITAGFVALVAAPVVFAASLVIRGIIAGWRRASGAGPPSHPEMRPGADPVLAGWVGVVWLGTLGLAWAMFQGTWLLASWTKFKPATIKLLAPALGVLAVLAIIALSRPAARWFAAIARALDTILPPRNRPSLVHPRAIVVGAIATAIAGGYLIWRLLVSRRLGYVDTGFLRAPSAGVAAAIAAHAAWRGGRAVRAILAPVPCAVVVAAIAIALHAARNEPELVLDVWADDPIARRAIELAFDVEAIRDRVPVGRFRLLDRAVTHPDFVLVTIEGVRADRALAAGAAMPALRELGRRGSVFASAYAPSSVMRRSVSSMITGVAPNRVRGWVDDEPSADEPIRLDPRHTVVAEWLRAGGYETAGFVCCADYWSADARTGWSRGLDHVAIVEPDSAAVARTARQWIDAREGRSANPPLFLWIHLRAPLGSVAFSAPRERGRLYDAALATTDAALAELLGGFARRAPERAPIAIVAAANGEPLGDHGQHARATDLYDSQIHVPLVLAGPGIERRRVDETVSLTDLAPTIVELAGFHLPAAHLEGRSLADLATGTRAAAANTIAFAAMIAERTGDSEPSAIVRGSWKLIDSGHTVELYDLKTDPEERWNLFGQRPQLVGELKMMLAAKLRAALQPPF